jgi:phosphate transport system substrate-binding protein
MKSVSWTNLSLFALSMMSLSAYGAGLKGAVRIDGSSTVYSISEAVAEDYRNVEKDVKVTIGAAGTGAGYKKFCSNELDVAGGSRPVKSDEVQKCKSSGVDLIELPVAVDGLTVVVNPKNTFVKSLSFEQLKKIWEPGSKIKTWKDLDSSWPDQPIKLFGPSSEHGTFDYFTEIIVGKAKSSRSDYSAASDTNTLVNGVSGDVNSLGYFGYGYYEQSKSKLRALGISKDGKSAPISADSKTIESGAYPLSRLLFISVNKKSAERPEVDSFVKFYLQSVGGIAKSVGYSALPKAKLEQSVTNYSKRKVGAWQESAH